MFLSRFSVAKGGGGFRAATCLPALRICVRFSFSSNSVSRRSVFRFATIARARVCSSAVCFAAAIALFIASCFRDEAAGLARARARRRSSGGGNISGGAGTGGIIAREMQKRRDRVTRTSRCYSFSSGFT